MHLVVEQC